MGRINRLVFKDYKFFLKQSKISHRQRQGDALSKKKVDLKYDRLSYELKITETKIKSDCCIIIGIAKFLSYIWSLILLLTNCIIKIKDFIVKIIKSIFKISYFDETKPSFNISETSAKDIDKYIDERYYKKLDNGERIDKIKLTKDLAAFKTYKNKIESDIKKGEIVFTFISIIVALLTFLIQSSGVQLPPMFILGATSTYVVLALIICFHLVSEMSETGKLNTINYTIYSLESIKEEHCFNPDYSEKKTNETASDEQKSDVIFDPDKSLDENIEDARSEDIINFIENYEFYYSDINLENLNEHLLIFRFCKNDLDRDLKNREVLINYFGVCISVAALIVAIIAVQNKPVNSKLLGYITLGIIIAYLIVMISASSKIFNDDEGGRKLVALQYAIDVLEMKKEELESEKED